MSNTYFVSDFHLGAPSYHESLTREKRIVSWLEDIKDDCECLYLLGDIFDFWYEYKTVVPRNYVRLLGKIAEYTDSGIPVYFFKGNHDMWTFDYLSTEIGVQVVDNELIMEINGKKFYLHHGDGIWPGEAGYGLVKKLFRSKWATWLFHRLHPNFGINLAKFMSRKSRTKNSKKDLEDLPIEKEYLYQFASDHLKNNDIDYYVFGHRHKPMNILVGDKARLFNLGDCVSHFTYGLYNGKEFEIKDM